VWPKLIDRTCFSVIKRFLYAPNTTTTTDNTDPNFVHLYYAYAATGTVQLPYYYCQDNAVYDRRSIRRLKLKINLEQNIYILQQNIYMADSFWVSGEV
jgi:hypothetical protein